MLAVASAWSVLVVSAHAAAQPTPAPAPPRLEVYAGPSTLMLLGPVSGEISLALDASIQGALHGAWHWTAGTRLGMSPIAPEVFARMTAQPRFGAWAPSAGLELGLTVRGLEDQGDRLLMELRDVSRRELAPLYVALHTAPLRFHASQRWRLSMLEIDIGTHVSPLGRYVRVQLLLAAIGLAL